MSWNNYILPGLTGRTSKYSIAADILVHGESLTKTKPGKLSEFIIDASNAKKSQIMPEIRFFNHLNKSIQIKHDIKAVSKNVFKCSYVIENSGTHNTCILS